MTDYREELTKALRAIRELGPALTHLWVAQDLYAQLHRETAARFVSTGHLTLPPLGPRVIVDPALPGGAYRARWSDGTERTHYRLVLDARLLRVAVSSVALRRTGKPQAYELQLQVRTFGWQAASDVWGRSTPSTEWEGQRSCPWSLMVSDLQRTVAELVEAGGLQLTDWQRDYLARAYYSREYVAPITLQTPRFGAGL